MKLNENDEQRTKKQNTNKCSAEKENIRLREKWEKREQKLLASERYYRIYLYADAHKPPDSSMKRTVKRHEVI